MIDEEITIERNRLTSGYMFIYPNTLSALEAASIRQNAGELNVRSTQSQIFPYIPGTSSNIIPPNKGMKVTYRHLQNNGYIMAQHSGGFGNLAQTSNTTIRWLPGSGTTNQTIWTIPNNPIGTVSTVEFINRGGFTAEIIFNGVSAGVQTIFMGTNGTSAFYINCFGYRATGGLGSGLTNNIDFLEIENHDGKIFLFNETGQETNLFSRNKY